MSKTNPVARRLLVVPEQTKNERSKKKCCHQQADQDQHSSENTGRDLGATGSVRPHSLIRSNLQMRTADPAGQGRQGLPSGTWHVGGRFRPRVLVTPVDGSNGPEMLEKENAAAAVRGGGTAILEREVRHALVPCHGNEPAVAAGWRRQ